MSCGSRGPGQLDVDRPHELAVRARRRRGAGRATPCRSRTRAARRCARRAWGGRRCRSGDGKPAAHAALPCVLEGAGIERVEVAALPEAREGLAVVDDDVGARRVLHAAAGAPAVVALGLLGCAEHARSRATRPPPARRGSRRCARTGCGSWPGRRGRRSGAASRRRRRGGSGRSTGAPGSRCCAGTRRTGRRGARPRPRGRRRPTRGVAAARRRSGRGGRRRRAASSTPSPAGLRPCRRP